LIHNFRICFAEFARSFRLNSSFSQRMIDPFNGFVNLPHLERHRIARANAHRRRNISETPH